MNLGKPLNIPKLLLYNTCLAVIREMHLKQFTDKRHGKYGWFLYCDNILINLVSPYRVPGTVLNVSHAY